MSENNIFQKLYNLICKDTGDRNESSKLIVVVRMLTLTMIVYSLINGVLFLLIDHTGGMIFCQLAIIAFLVIFILSYRQHTFVSYCVLNIAMLVWLTANVYMFGWGIGVQTYIFVLIVFCFFARYRHETAKILYVLALLALRMHLYFHCQNYSPDLTVSAEINAAFQTVNSVSIFWSLALLSYYFSTDTQALEGKLIEYNEQLRRQASIDPLTGLNNRRSTMEYLEKLLKNAVDQISICLCDIDFFKKVNDTYGHNIGDVVLQKIAETFRKDLLPYNCFVSRWGGEEFLLIFPQANGDEAKIALDALRRTINGIVFDGGIAQFSISMTFGLVEYDFHSDITTLLKEADEKLYLGKENGRDQIVF